MGEHASQVLVIAQPYIVLEQHNARGPSHYVGHKSQKDISCRNLLHLHTVQVHIINPSALCHIMQCNNMVAMV